MNEPVAFGKKETISKLGALVSNVIRTAGPEATLPILEIRIDWREGDEQ